MFQRFVVVLFIFACIIPACMVQNAPAGDWLSVGTGDCPGRDVAGSTGPNPDPGRCNGQFSGYTAVCWNNNCTYKNVATASCTGGSNPGRMYTCGNSVVPTQSVGTWLSVGTGDCPGRDVAGSTGPNPDPGKCNGQFSGYTAVCWNNNCTYKNVATASCTGGSNPGRMYTCGSSSMPASTPVVPAASTGNWINVGTGDCPGRDVAGSTGPNPDPGKCNGQFSGYTAVCWNNNCTYKNVATASCTGGSNPGRMYTCGSSSMPASTPVVPAASTGNWINVGTGDCPGRDVAGSTGPNPDPGKCNGQFSGYTAVCWNNNCTYKNVATASCTGGSNPGRMYTCGSASTTPAAPAASALSGRWTLNANGFVFRADVIQRDRLVTGTMTPINHQGSTSTIDGSFDGRELNFTRSTPGSGSQQYHGFLFLGIESGNGIGGTFRSGGLDYGWYATK